MGIESKLAGTRKKFEIEDPHEVGIELNRYSYALEYEDHHEVGIELCFLSHTDIQKNPHNVGIELDIMAISWLEYLQRSPQRGDRTA